MIPSATTGEPGSLFLHQIQLVRQGRDAVGCDFQDLLAPVARRPRKAQGNCQRLIVWFWVTPRHAWPIAFRLYLPYRWTLRSRQIRRTGVPPEHQRYQTKEAIALDLLGEIQSELGYTAPILVDESFTESWDFYETLDHKSGLLLAKLHPSLPWPIDSQIVASGLHREQWKFLHKYKHMEACYLWRIEAMTIAKKEKTQTFLQRMPSTKGMKGLPTFERYLFLQGNPAGTLGVYLLSKQPEQRADIIALTKRFELVQDACVRLMVTGGLRRFEGRTWQGLHHHLTLCCMAEYFRCMRGR